MKIFYFLFITAFIATSIDAQTFTNVADINPSGNSSINYLYQHQGELIFRADNGTQGVEFWSSDGTTAGTQLVQDINAGSGSSSPLNFSSLGSNLIFTATEGTAGQELYLYDGTTTSLLKDINPGAASSQPYNFQELNGKLFFRANNGTIGSELWSTDGTTAGTVLIKDINPGSGSGMTTILAASANNIYFVADNGTTGKELWISDGTATGTTLLKDINPSGSSLSAFSKFIEISPGNFIFEANDGGTTGYELWRTDGTTAGTVLVKDINPGSNNGLPDLGVVANGKLYFEADNGSDGKELWITDGTTAGTNMVKDINPGAGTSSCTRFTEHNGKIYFSAEDGINGKELWVTDGTSAGTNMLIDINIGAGNGFPERITNYNGNLLFIADDGVNGDELYLSDGTTAGTSVIQPAISPNASPLQSTTQFVELNGELYFGANYDSKGHELWKLNIDVPLSVTDIKNTAVIDIFPNPTKNKLSLVYAGQINSVNIQNIAGQIIPVPYKNSHKEIFLGNLPAGFYTITINTEEGIVTRKFIKE